MFVVFLNDLTGGVLPEFVLYVMPLVIIAIGTLINLATVRVNGFATTALTAVKVGLVLVIGLGAFLLADGNWGHFTLSGASGTCEGVPESARFGIGGFGAAMLGATCAAHLIVEVDGELGESVDRKLARVAVGLDDDLRARSRGEAGWAAA